MKPSFEAYEFPLQCAWTFYARSVDLCSTFSMSTFPVFISGSLRAMSSLFFCSSFVWMNVCLQGLVTCTEHSVSVCMALSFCQQPYCTCTVHGCHFIWLFYFPVLQIEPLGSFYDCIRCFISSHSKRKFANVRFILNQYTGAILDRGKHQLLLHFMDGHFCIASMCVLAQHTCFCCP